MVVVAAVVVAAVAVDNVNERLKRLSQGWYQSKTYEVTQRRELLLNVL
jgi:hypothetical protein